MSVLRLGLMTFRNVNEGGRSMSGWLRKNKQAFVLVPRRRTLEPAATLTANVRVSTEATTQREDF
jgi:hypothetical protein